MSLSSISLSLVTDANCQLFQGKTTLDFTSFIGQGECSDFQARTRMGRASDASVSAMLESPYPIRSRFGLDVNSGLNSRCLSQKLATRYRTRVPKENAQRNRYSIM
uniref:Uncharacterized protein n=1 Tax=Magallana gigas TaxID=29159 RepID=K1RFR8_MAGGI